MADKMKTLDVSDSHGAKKAIPDIKIFGDGDLFKLLSKASSESEGWMKSTKGMDVPGSVGIPGAVVLQVTTQQRNPDGSYSIAEALTYVPGVILKQHPDGGIGLAPWTIEMQLMTNKGGGSAIY